MTYSVRLDCHIKRQMTAPLTVRLLSFASPLFSGFASIFVIMYKFIPLIPLNVKENLCIIYNKPILRQFSKRVGFLKNAYGFSRKSKIFLIYKIGKNRNVKKYFLKCANKALFVPNFEKFWAK